MGDTVCDLGEKPLFLKLPVTQIKDALLSSVEHNDGCCAVCSEVQSSVPLPRNFQFGTLSHG